MSEVILKNISKSYNDKTIIERMSHTFKEGTFFVMGGSGIGKTTLVRLISHLEPLSSGEVVSEGKIGIVFQEDRLIESFSAIKNIKLVTTKSKEEILEEMSALGLSTCVNRPVKQLSGGERRRLCILRSLIIDPDILLLDEAFTGLDSISKEKSIKYIISKKPQLLISVTHDATDAEAFDGRVLNFTRNQLIG